MFTRFLIAFSLRVIDIFALFSCTASEGLLLLVANQNKIVADNVTSQVHNIYSLVQDGSYIVALDFDSVSGRIFWSDLRQGKTWSAFQNGTDKRVVSTLL
jgi:low density lipoprotein-related protein 2